jgi:hypothetical protein
MIVRYRHPSGFSLPLPAEWERVEDPAPGIALIAVEPEHGGAFRANLVVTVEPVPPGLDLDAWQARAEERQAAVLRGYVILDRERLELQGRAAVRRLVHHAREDVGSITLEEWAVADEGRGITLSASAGTLEYDALAALFSGVAGELRP